MLKTCFSLALIAICYCCITNSHTSPSALKWYLTCAPNNSFSDQRHVPFSWSVRDSFRDKWVSLPRHPVGVDPCEGALYQLAEPTAILSLSQGTLYIMGITITSTGPDAATGHDLCLSQVLLLSKSAVRCCCHNVLLSSQHTPATLAPITCTGVLLHINSVQRYMGLYGKP